MPFGYNREYKDFNDCLKKSKDKRNPGAYCATIMRATETRHRKAFKKVPRPKTTAAKYCKACGKKL